MAQEVIIAGRSYSLSETLRSAELAPIFEDAWTASRVWEASRFLAERLVHFASGSPVTFNVSAGQSVLELGSGCGLAGLVAASLGADVLLTDQREALELLERNVETNATSNTERARLHVAEFVWGSDWSSPRSSYNYILVSDCINPIYGQDSWRNLARSIYRFSNEETITYLAHEARGEDEAMGDFLDSSAAMLRLHRGLLGPRRRFPFNWKLAATFQLRRLAKTTTVSSNQELCIVKPDTTSRQSSYFVAGGATHFTVAAEDRDFFARESELEADKELTLAVAEIAKETRREIGS
ncbi:Lysine methyltransferase [Phytophthora infestans]|uniref:Lysine methyltransferase n=1 Tax=Phytophthora infestans TaxID=4787 RepID=A0A833W750_PHYIN|nr:Lysine methyltransferase [Phytophthora infestans]